MRHAPEIAVLPKDERPAYVWGREELAARTSGRLTGRSTLKQQEYLEKLGVPRSKTVTWTKYHASKEIEKRTRRLKPATARPGALSRPTLNCPSDTPQHRAGTPQHGKSRHGEATPGSELPGGRVYPHPQVNSQTEKSPRVQS